jgi:hypothetical protein
MCICLRGRAEAAGLHVDDNTGCDLPHLLVMQPPTERRPDGLFMQIEDARAIHVEDVLHFFSIHQSPTR